MFLYFFLLFSTGCRSKALRDSRFTDFNKSEDGDCVLSLYESKTNKTFMRIIPLPIYDEIMKIKANRQAEYDDDPDSIDPERLRFVFTFRSR